MTVVAESLGLWELLRRAPAIQGVDVWQVTLRKKDPTWRFALAANPTNAGFVIRLRSEGGLVGYGSASEIGHIGHSFEEIERSLGRAVPALEAAHSGTDDGESALGRLEGPARAIVHTALLDLVARSEEVPLCRLLGEEERPELPVTRIVSLKSPAQMAQVATGLVAEGYRHLKVKLDNNTADLDVERVKAIRGAVGPGVGITVDANQSYQPQAAVAVANEFAAYRVDLFEQPTPASDLEGMRYARERSPIPVEADESASTVEDVRRLTDNGAADGVSLKAAKLGGVDRMIEAAKICEEAGVYVRIGAHVGSRILNAVALHAACVLPLLQMPAELAEFERLLGDPAQGLPIEDGTIRLPRMVGLGVSVADDFKGEG